MDWVPSECSSRLLLWRCRMLSICLFWYKNLFKIRITSLLTTTVELANLYTDLKRWFRFLILCRIILSWAQSPSMERGQWSGNPIYPRTETSENSLTLAKLFLIYRKMQFDTQGNNGFINTYYFIHEYNRI